MNTKIANRYWHRNLIFLSGRRNVLLVSVALALLCGYQWLSAVDTTRERTG